MPSKNELGPDDLELGYVSGVFGVRGEVRLFLFNPDSTFFAEPRVVRLVGPDGARTVTLSARPGAGKRILGRVEGVTSKEEARELMDHRIVVSRASLPELDDDEFYDWQIEGAEVIVDDEVRGRVVSVHHPGPVDLFEIDVGGPEPVFVPCTQELVLHIDVQTPSVTLAPGSLDEEPDAL